jgi:S1-C subfamily serine protease
MLSLTSSVNPDRQAKLMANASVIGRSQTHLSVAEVARLVTVRIFRHQGAGSGVIVRHQGQTYTVLTCDHVVNDESRNNYKVLTADGVTYLARRLRQVQFNSLDVALVQFESTKSYQVVALGDSEALSVGDRLYAAGFPNDYFSKNANYIESTHNWGTKAFVMTTGEVSMLSQKGLPRGYSLGYSNDVREGMSGGPILNEKGKLVGINGRLKYPLQGIDVFYFADNTRPSQTLFEKMEALSWAIPISRFQRLISGT